MGHSHRFHYAGAIAALVFLTGATPEYPRAITAADRAMIEPAVRRGLIDPDSARFRWYPQMRDDGIYCGFVNAKNRMGGYTGFTLFMSLIGKRADGTQVVAFTKLAHHIGPLQESAEEQMCAKYGYSLDPTAADLTEY